MMSNNRVKVKICGAEYAMITDQSEEYVLDLAYEIDRDMKQIMNTSGRATATTAAVLTAFSYLDKERRSREAADHMRQQINEYIQEAARARLEIEELKSRLARNEK